MQPQRKSGCSLRSVLICLLVAIGIAAALIFNFVHDLQTAERDVRAKHLEATTVIQRIYAHYNRTGKWPAEDVVEPWLPAGWNYYFKPLPLPANPPLLLRHAEYHMQLAYYFLPPKTAESIRRGRYQSRETNRHSRRRRHTVLAIDDCSPSNHGRPAAWKVTIHQPDRELQIAQSISSILNPSTARTTAAATIARTCRAIQSRIG